MQLDFDKISHHLLLLDFGLFPELIHLEYNFVLLVGKNGIFPH